MHSRDKGKSGSTRPSKTTKATWVRHKPKEVELITVKLGKEGKSSSEIGMIFRDVYGIPSIKEVTGKTVSKILEEKKLAPKIPEDLLALIKKAVAISKHLDENKQDKTGKRGLQLTESKINRLVKYYKRTGKLSQDWKYDKSSIQLYI